MDSQAQPPKLLAQVRDVLRLHHYSLHTERSYLDWIKRYVQFHHMRCREDLAEGEKKIEAFLTDLAVRGQVAASTQNQAMNALVFLYRKVLEQPLGERIAAVRAERKVNVPVVLTREEVTRAASVRHEVVFETAWLDWNPDQVLRVAAGILRKRASDGMPRNTPGSLPEV